MLRHIFSASLLAGVSLVAIGCGGGSGDAPATVAAKGTVTVDGKAMGKLSVMFMPTKGKVATGVTDDQGQFSLTTNTPGDGATVGAYTVSVSPIQEVGTPMPGMDGYVKPGPPPFARKYTDNTKSGLTATVDADASKNDFKFDLSSK